MIPRINYDFSEFESILEDIKRDPTSSKMGELKRELNSFFKDSTCLEVVYTNNTDKMFFGMSVVPFIDPNDVYVIVQDDKPYRITKYYLELDSKLFSPMLALSTDEMVAVLLHEVGHLVNDTTPVDIVRKNIDVYLAKNDTNIILSKSIHYKEILAFGIKDAIRKVSSLFEQDNEELMADEFVVSCGYGNELASAFDKIVKNSYNINKDVDNKIVVLSWVLRLYGDIKLRRIPAIRTLEKSKALTGSKLDKRDIENVVRRLNRIDDDALLEASLDSIKDKYSSTLKRIKYKGIRSFEDDLYEYNLRVKNTQSEDDALVLLHQINVRMSIIDDYIQTEDLDERSKKRWFDLYDKYDKIRGVLSNKSVYKDDYSRLYITYPDIIDNK